MALSSAHPQVQTLPELRQELRIEAGAKAPDESATWTIVDAAQHLYVQIDATAYHLLSRWKPGISCEELARIVERDFGDDVSGSDVEQFVYFLAVNNFIVEAQTGSWRQLLARAENADKSWLSWLLHNYLYFRIPLVRPEQALKRMSPNIEMFYTRGYALIVATAGLIGLYLVSRQWDAFYHTFQYFFSWQGLAAYALALVFIKSAHELGHAFTATRFGCRVPTMGVCFIVLFPVLYTDVTDAWRLRSRRERFLIGIAGVSVELAIACFATLAWSFLPDGVFRSIAFFLATVGWVLSLVVNLNPLMRFDGYYLFSDFIGVDNLQSRAFEFGRWKMRELLFGLGRRPPEALPESTEKTLIIYAWCVWVYRLLLFTGIALLVYHMTFKALGIVLFAVEIIFFVAAPIGRELQRWWADGANIRATRRTRITTMVAVSGLLVLFVPWSGSVSVPAILESSQLARVFPKYAGEVEAVVAKAGDDVVAGQPLVRMTSIDLDHRMDLTKRKLDLVRLRLARRASDTEDRTTSLVLEQELKALIVALDGLEKEKSDLTIVAPISGRVAEFNSEIQPGRAIPRNEFIALIRGEAGLVARGYIPENDVSLVSLGTEGRFIPDVPTWPSIPVTVADISAVGASSIEIPELESDHGGSIAVRRKDLLNGAKRAIPVSANYFATFNANQQRDVPNFSARGVIVLSGKAESIASQAARQIASVLVRESGF